MSKYALLAISISSLFLFSFCIMSFGTYSYFTAQADYDLSVRNATKDELVQITEGQVEYADKCLAKVPVTIHNIFDFKVIISIDDTEYTLQPGESVTHTQVVADQCNEFGDRSFTIIGYENYFTHPINVTVEKEKLNPCPPQSDNGQGKPNDKGNGKQCGHTDTKGGTDEPVPAMPDEEVEKKEVPNEDEKAVKDQNETKESSEETKEENPVKDEVKEEPAPPPVTPEEKPEKEKEQPEQPASPKQSEPPVIQEPADPAATEQPISSQSVKDENEIVEESAS